MIRQLNTPMVYSLVNMGYIRGIHSGYTLLSLLSYTYLFTYPYTPNYLYCTTLSVRTLSNTYT